MSLHDATVPELLGQYAAILAELHRRGVIRTRNAPLGDYAEHLALSVYGGEIAANSAKSYDITAADGRLVQVKARTVAETTKLSAKYSAFRSWDFDVAVFVAFEASTYGLVYAREVPAHEVREAARFSSHVNASTVSLRVVPRLGADVSDQFRMALAGSR